jgi:hypothetical protein
MLAARVGNFVMRGSVIAAGIGLAAFVVARLAAPRVIRSAPPWSFRTNVAGREVPVVLGWPVVVIGVVGAAVAGTFVRFLDAGFPVAVPMTGAVTTAAMVLALAGYWDDRRGSERARGFAGHLGALKGRAVTGGVVKIGGGLIAGLATAALIGSFGAPPLAHVLEAIAVVGLTANLINLLDRAPGRAAKATFAIGIPLAFLTMWPWGVVAAPFLGALAGAFQSDLRERAMLGDAGANPLGAILGVGLVAAMGTMGRLVAIGVLLALNVASEFWSFSAVIEKVAPLRWLDRLGRLQEHARD